MAVEYLEDDHGAVHHLAADFLFQIACLRGRNFVVDKDDFDWIRVPVRCLGRRRQLCVISFRRQSGFVIGFVIHEAADFRALAGETGQPIIIYNVVPWTSLSPPLLLRIMREVPGVIGVSKSPAPSLMRMSPALPFGVAPPEGGR